MIFLKYLTIALAYFGLALGYLPGLRMNRATIALVGSAFVIALGILSLKDAWDAIDAPTIVFLFSMMIVNASLYLFEIFSSCVDGAIECYFRVRLDCW